MSTYESKGLQNSLWTDSIRQDQLAPWAGQSILYREVANEQSRGTDSGLPVDGIEEWVVEKVITKPDLE